MTHSGSRQQERRESISYCVGACSLGTVLAAWSQNGVCAIFLGDDRNELVRDLQDRFNDVELISGDRKCKVATARVIDWIDGPSREFDVPLDVRGTAFQKRVWDALREVPAGTTVSYTQIAKRIGQASAVRAVAGACAANPIAVIIPCHRVVRSDGSISGYHWGVARKRQLLEREAKFRAAA